MFVFSLKNGRRGEERTEIDRLTSSIHYFMYCCTKIMQQCQVHSSDPRRSLPAKFLRTRTFVPVPTTKIDP